MKAVFQTTVEQGDGDCMRAVVASLLDMTIEQVPHFIRFGEKWLDMYLGFLELCGWEYVGNNSPGGVFPQIDGSINGYFYAVVPSSLYPDGTHAVVMDLNGIIVHDPNPNKHYLGKSLKAAGVMYWHMFEKIIPADPSTENKEEEK